MLKLGAIVIDKIAELGKSKNPIGDIVHLWRKSNWGYCSPMERIQVGILFTYGENPTGDINRGSPMEKILHIWHC